MARHGTRRGYDLGCRCFDCSLANSRYKQEWRAGKRTPMAGTAKVRRHLLWLNEERGMGMTAIAAAARVHVRTVHDVLRGRQSRIHVDKADRLLGVIPSDDRLVDGAETWRRIRELKAVGLHQYQIAEVIRGYKPRTATYPRPGRWPGGQKRQLQLNRTGRIHRRNAEAVHRFYVRYFHEVLKRATPEEMRRQDVARDEDRRSAAQRARRRKEREEAAA